MCKVTQRRIGADIIKAPQAKKPIAAPILSDDPLFADDLFLSITGTPLFTPLNEGSLDEGFPFPIFQMENQIEQQPPQPQLQQEVQVQQPQEVLSAPQKIDDIVLPTTAMLAEPKLEAMWSDDSSSSTSPRFVEEFDDDHHLPLSPLSSPQLSPMTSHDDDYDTSSSDESDSKDPSWSAVTPITSKANNNNYSQKKPASKANNNSKKITTSTNVPLVANSSRGASRRVLHNPCISEDKRERNRLAAQKYRQKGRDLTTTLEKQCAQLLEENSCLKSRNAGLEEELAYLRGLIKNCGVNVKTE